MTYKGNPRGPSRPIPGVQVPKATPPAESPHSTKPQPSGVPLSPFVPGTLSVVQGLWNQPVQWLRYNLATIAGQTQPPFEVVMVNASSDRAWALETAAVCGKYDELVRRVDAPLVKFNLSRIFNIGLRAARGEYIMFAASDQFYSANFLAEVQAAMRPGILVGAFRGNLPQGYDLGKPSTVLARWPALVAKTETPIKWPPGTAVCVRRDWLERVRGYDEVRTPYNYCDADITERAVADGLQIEIVPWAVAQVLHVWHPYPQPYYDLGGRAPDIHAGIVRNNENWGQP